MNFKPNMLFLNRSFDKKRLKALLLWFRLNLSENAALKAVEILQGLGFRSATQGAISLGLDDLKTPTSKSGRVFQAQVEVALAHHEHHRGNRTPVELFQHLVDTWHRTSQDLTTEVVQLFHSTERVNPVYMMAFSGARGNISQVRQLVGMRGLMADPRGQIVGFPILSNFREGLTITEYFVSCYGARKGVVDTAIRTADAGYLTRRLADVSHHVVVRTTNCGTHESILLRDIKEGQKTILSLANRLVGRVLAEHVFLPASLASSSSTSHHLSQRGKHDTSPVCTKQKRAFTPTESGAEDSVQSYTKTEGTLQSFAYSYPRNTAEGKCVALHTPVWGKSSMSSPLGSANKGERLQQNFGEDKTKTIIYRNSEITSLLASKLAAHYLEVPVRSPLSCSLPWGVCQLCYGWGLSEGRRVTLGEAVGIIAAQSIGEPGTQLTLRTFHTGGVFSGELLNEIRAPYNGNVIFPIPLQGLLLRTPHGQIAFLTKVSGKMKISEPEMHFENKKDNLDPLIPLKDSKDDSKFSNTWAPYVQSKEGVNANASVARVDLSLRQQEVNLLQQHEGQMQINKRYDVKNELGLPKQDSEFFIQPSTVIFVKQKEYVVNNQLLAEFSSSTLQSVNDQIEITQQVLSDTAGQIWFKELEYGNRKGPGSGSLGTYFSSQKLGGIWVLAGKPMIDTHPSFVSPFDKSYKSKIQRIPVGLATICNSSSLLTSSTPSGTPGTPGGNELFPLQGMGMTCEAKKMYAKHSTYPKGVGTHLGQNKEEVVHNFPYVRSKEEQRVLSYSYTPFRESPHASAEVNPRQIKTFHYLYSFPPAFARVNPEYPQPFGVSKALQPCTNLPNQKFVQQSETGDNEYKVKPILSFIPRSSKESENEKLILYTDKRYPKSLKSFIPLVTIVRGKQKLQIENNISSNIIKEIRRNDFCATRRSSFPHAIARVNINSCASFSNNCDKFFVLSNLSKLPKIDQSLLKRKNLFKYHTYGMQNRLKRSINTRYTKTCIIHLQNNYRYSLQNNGLLGEESQKGLKYDYVVGYSQAASSKKHTSSSCFLSETTFQHNSKSLLFKYRKNNKFIIHAKQQRHLTSRAKQSFAEVNKSVKAFRDITLRQPLRSKSYKSKIQRIPVGLATIYNSPSLLTSSTPSGNPGTPGGNALFPLQGMGMTCETKKMYAKQSTYPKGVGTHLGQNKATDSLAFLCIQRKAQRVKTLWGTHIRHDKSFKKGENKIKKSTLVFQELRSSESNFSLMQTKTRGSRKKLDMLPLLVETDLVTFVTNTEVINCSATNSSSSKSQSCVLQPLALQGQYLPLQGTQSKAESSYKYKSKICKKICTSTCTTHFTKQSGIRVKSFWETRGENKKPMIHSCDNMRTFSCDSRRSIDCKAMNNLKRAKSCFAIENVISLPPIPVLPPLTPYFNKTSFFFSTSLSLFNSFNVSSNCDTSSDSLTPALLALPLWGMGRTPFSKAWVRGLLPHVLQYLPLSKMWHRQSKKGLLFLRGQKLANQKKAKKVSTAKPLSKTWGKQVLLNFAPKSYLLIQKSKIAKSINNKFINVINKSYLSTVLINKEITNNALITSNPSSTPYVQSKEGVSAVPRSLPHVIARESSPRGFSPAFPRVTPMDCFVSQGNKSSYFITEKRRLQSMWIQKKRAYLIYLDHLCSLHFTQQFTRDTKGYTAEAFTHFISRTNLQLSTFCTPSKNFTYEDITSKIYKPLNKVVGKGNDKTIRSNGLPPDDARVARVNPIVSSKVNRKGKLCRPPFPGQLVTYGDNIGSNIVTTESGQILYIDSQKTTVRKAQTVLIYSQAIIAVLSGDWIKKGTPLMSLSYQKLVTGDIVQGLPKIEQFFEAPVLRDGTFWNDSLQAKLNQFFQEEREKLPLAEAVRKGFSEIQRVLVEGVLRVYISQGVLIADKHLEVIVRQMTCKGRILYSGDTGFLRNELVSLDKIENVNQVTYGQKALYHPQVRGITDASLESESFLSAASFQETTRVLSRDAIIGKTDLMRGLKERVIVGELIPAGTGLANNSVYNLLAHSVANK